RVRSRCGTDAVLRPAEARADDAAHVEGVDPSYSEKAIQRVTGIIWHLPAVGLSTDRDHLTPGPLRVVAAAAAGGSRSVPSMRSTSMAEASSRVAARVAPRVALAAGVPAAGSSCTAIW